jgi:integrase
MIRDMGRPKGRFSDLPPHMTGRESGDKVHYYHQRDGKKTPLGTDKAAALRKWAALEAGGIETGFLTVSDAYRDHVKKHLTPESYNHYRIALDNLDGSFGKGKLEQILPVHVKSYILERTKKGAALFEKRVLSAMWNWAREKGITACSNPCAGVKFSKSEKKSLGKLGKRDVYVTDAMFSETYLRAEWMLQDCMDFALLTAQRPSDLLKMKRADIRDGALWVVQIKTGARVGIRIEGELKRVLERVLARPRRIQSMYIIADEDGQRWTYAALNKAFGKARGDAKWQFRDIRAKAASDSPDLKAAQGLLGHANETTTTVYRRSKGTPVAPLK